MPNARIQRQVKPVPLRACAAHFRPCVLTDPTAVLHHADLLPPDFTAPVCATWHRVGDVADLIEPERLVPRAMSCAPKQSAILARTEVPGGARLREKVVYAMPMRRQVHKGINHEASLHVAELKPRARAMPTWVLQQCYIPESGFPGFAQGGPAAAPMEAKVLDASIRHCSRDRASALPWAPEDVLSFVLRYKQRTWSRARGKAGGGTRELVASALPHSGRCDRPYQLHATLDQSDRAHPAAAQLRRARQQVDPAGKVAHAHWRKYL